MSTTDIVVQQNARRRSLLLAVSAITTEVGFESADKAALETLTEMLQSCISEIGRSSRAFCELSCRIEPLVGDVVMALVDMGLSVESIHGFAKRPNRLSLPHPTQTTQPQTPKILQAGQKHPHPSHIPDYLPPFPDPHAYIRTATYKQPITEYQIVRDKVASQKRDVERALTRFIAKTGETHRLFDDDTNLFPLIACKAIPQPYFSALLPKDQMFEEGGKALTETPVLKGKQASMPNQREGITEQKKEESEGEAIDNPYLQPTKLPKKRKR